MTKQASHTPHTIATGFAVGLDSLTNLEFRIDRPYRCCLVCGAVFQTESDRRLSPLSAVARQEWANSHSKTHPASLHRKLAMSGNFALPDAALKLAAFGIFSLNDLVLSDEVSDALGEAPRQPNNDAEGGS